VALRGDVGSMRQSNVARQAGARCLTRKRDQQQATNRSRRDSRRTAETHFRKGRRRTKVGSFFRAVPRAHFTLFCPALYRFRSNATHRPTRAAPHLLHTHAGAPRRRASPTHHRYYYCILRFSTCFVRVLDRPSTAGRELHLYRQAYDGV